MNNISVISLQHYFNSLPEYKCPICGGKDFTIFSSFGFEVDKFVPLSFKRYKLNENPKIENIHSNLILRK